VRSRNRVVAEHHVAGSASTEDECAVADQLEREPDPFYGHTRETNTMADLPLPEAAGDPDRGKIGRQASELLDLLCAIHLHETPLEGVETQIALAAPPSQEVCGMFSRLFRRPHTCILQDRIARVQRGNLPRACGAGGVTGACPVCARMLT
jgi:hypothetical protein